MKNLFFKKVYEIVSRIPKGKVISYGKIASFLGNPRQGRIVGWAMHSSPNGIPWHRVVMKNGKLPFQETQEGYLNQYNLLLKEGISFSKDKTVDMEKHEWKIELPL